MRLSENQNLLKKDLECQGENDCTRLHISYASNGSLCSSTKDKKSTPIPAGIGWQNHFSFCFAKFEKGRLLISKRRVFAFKRQSESLDLFYDSPIGCVLTQFHVAYIYKNNVTVVNLISDKVVLAKDFEPMKTSKLL